MGMKIIFRLFNIIANLNATIKGKNALKLGLYWHLATH